MDELARAAPEGVRVLDAPFSGTAQVAAAGGLTLLVGGEASPLELARPVLSAFASTILPVGPQGAGRGLKLINNLLFAAQMSLADEALQAAAALGLDRQAAALAIGQCSGASYAMAKFTDSRPHASVGACVLSVTHAGGSLTVTFPDTGAGATAVVAGTPLTFEGVVEDQPLLAP